MKSVVANNYVSKVYADFYINYLKNHHALDVKTCFDIGSSSGVFVDELNKMGIDAEGIESDAWKIQSPKVKQGSFDLNYAVGKKYDIITMPQVIYFLGEVEQILSKLKSMLTSKGKIFIVTSPNRFQNNITKSTLKTYKLPTKEEYHEICTRLGFTILDYSVYQSDIGVAFNDGKLKAIQRLIAFKSGLKKTIIEDPNGNHVYLLLTKND